MLSQRYERWLETAKGIGKPELPFLDRVYSPNSRVPCCGMVEWIAEAWRDKDFLSIELLLGGLFGLPGDTFDMAPHVRGSIRDNVRYMVEARDAGLINGLDSNALDYLFSALLIKTVRSGLRGEMIIAHGASHLLPASILGDDFKIPDPVSCIDYLNGYIEKMKNEEKAERGSHFWSEFPSFSYSDAEPSSKDVLDEIRMSRDRVAALTVAARMHVLDILWYWGAGMKDRRIQDCTSYPTRESGCYIAGTVKEIIDNDLVCLGAPIDQVERRIRKEDLFLIFEKVGITFKRGMRRKDLIGLVRRAAEPELREFARSEGYFSISEELRLTGQDLVAFELCEGKRLMLWEAGVLTPQMQARRPPGGPNAT